MDYEQSIPTVPVELVEVELTTRQAAERYGCDNYSTFHNRMVKLGIKPERRGRQSFLSQEQIQLTLGHLPHLLPSIPTQKQNRLLALLLV